MLGLSVRRGFSLPELLVSILVLTVIGGAIHESMLRQQQVFRSIVLMVAARGDVRDAAEVLAADLAVASPLDTLPLAADSAVEFYSVIGASVMCDSAPAGAIRLPPEKLLSGHRFTTLVATPDSGDILLVFHDDSAAGEPRWDRHLVAAVSSQPAATACPATTGFTSAGDAAAPSPVISLRTATSAGIPAGAPIRILRRSRYSLYRSSDSRWYVGSRRCNSTGQSACGTIQPVSGPYAAYSGGAASSGLALRYYGARGEQLVLPGGYQTMARIDLTVRSRSRASSYSASPQAPVTDSTAISIALRNRD